MSINVQCFGEISEGAKAQNGTILQDGLLRRGRLRTILTHRMNKLEKKERTQEHSWNYMGRPWPTSTGRTWDKFHFSERKFVEKGYRYSYVGIETSKDPTTFKQERLVSKDTMYRNRARNINSKYSPYQTGRLPIQLIHQGSKFGLQEEFGQNTKTFPWTNFICMSCQMLPEGHH